MKHYPDWLLTAMWKAGCGVGIPAPKKPKSKKLMMRRLRARRHKQGLNSAGHVPLKRGRKPKYA